MGSTKEAEMTPETIPVTIAPEAARRVAELAMQAELHQMIEHTLASVSHLVQLDVVLEERFDLGGEPGITLWALRAVSDGPEDRTERDWGQWKVGTFPPRVCQHFALLVQ